MLLTTRLTQADRGESVIENAQGPLQGS